MIKEIKTVDEFYEMKDDKNIEIKVVKICTSWQEECKLYKQIFEKISEEYKKFPKIGFYEIDYENKEFSEIFHSWKRLDIKSVPLTLTFLKDKILYVDRIPGVISFEKLQEIIDSYYFTV